MSTVEPWFNKRRALILSTIAVLAGCGTPVIVPGENATPYTYSGTSAALSGKQTSVIVYGDPFPGSDPRTLPPAIAQSMINGAPLIDTQFVPLPAGAARPEYSVVMAFNTVGNIGPRDLCDETTNVQTDPNRRPIQLQAAFCGRGPLTTSTGWLSNAQGPQDPEFQNLVFGVTRTLFPDRAGNGSDSPS